MTHFSAIEINIRRKLCRCEGILKDEDRSENLDNASRRYIYEGIKIIEGNIVNLKRSPNKPPDEVIQSFYQRLKMIKDRVCHDTNEDCNSNKSHGVDPKSYVMPTGKEYASMRKELLDSDGVRTRKKKITGNNTENLELLLQEQRQRQDKITENMLSLTRNLKEQTLLAGDIVRNDTDKFEKSKGLADVNYDKLKEESLKMEEQQTKSWRWWVLCLMFVGVIILFVNMVLFMKVMKKSS